MDKVRFEAQFSTSELPDHLVFTKTKLIQGLLEKLFWIVQLNQSSHPSLEQAIAREGNPYKNTDASVGQLLSNRKYPKIYGRSGFLRDTINFKNSMISWQNLWWILAKDRIFEWRRSNIISEKGTRNEKTNCLSQVAIRVLRTEDNIHPCNAFYGATSEKPYIIWKGRKSCANSWR